MDKLKIKIGVIFAFLAIIFILISGCSNEVNSGVNSELDINNIGIIKGGINNGGINNITNIVGDQQMKIKSVFENMGDIPKVYTCQGEDISPELIFEDVPKNAKSLVLIVDDPDAPNKTWTHWVLWDISPQIKGIGSGDEIGKRGLNDFGRLDYGGPCPPSGKHRYFFRLYALDTMLNLKEGSSRPMLEKAMEGHVIEKAEIIGMYKKI